MSKFNKGILIISHPDDECLFSTSILESISTLIFCYNKVPNEQEISLSREKAINSYPLEHLKIVSLDIDQAKKSFWPINWLNVKEKKSGLEGGYIAKKYDRNYLKILDKLREIIPKNSLIISHNPWGEYGHSEHCQVFKASFQIAIETDSMLFVDCYCSNLTKLFAERKLHLFKPSIYELKTNVGLYKLLKNHYSKLGCWTWYSNYKLPIKEFLLQVDLSIDPLSKNISRDIDNFPLVYMNFIHPIYYYIIGVLKNFLPKEIRQLLRKFRFLKLLKK